MTVRSDNKDHILNTINGSVEFDDITGARNSKKAKNFGSPNKVTSKKGNASKVTFEQDDSARDNLFSFKKQKSEVEQDLDKNDTSILKEGGDQDLTNLDGIATNMNIIDNEAPPIIKARQLSPESEDEQIERTQVTVNEVKKYNRQLRKIENGDGSTIDLSGPALDLYSYTVLMMLNPNVE